MHPLAIERASTTEDAADTNEEKDLVRLSTACSVEDGKTTLIGRLLYVF